jgi:molybdate transport system substrate-binding protein
MRPVSIIAALVASVGLLLAACQPVPEPQRLTVFAAASLTEAFTELGEAFKADHPEMEITFNFAGSQQLVQQLAQGAPADVFASANQAQMNAAITGGRLSANDAQAFASNRLVVIYPASNPAGLSRLQDLSKPGLKLVLADQGVPVGDYSLQFLEKVGHATGFESGFMQQALSNVVSYEENVRAVYSKVALGEADAGIVYATDIPHDSPHSLGMLEIPEALNVVAEYPIAPIQDSANAELAAAFIDFVLSTQGQDILAQYGFSPVP